MNASVLITLPDEYQQTDHAVKVKHEEEAICWLWAFPLLLQRKSAITWLYTPVVGNKQWPGDLWGVDRTGDLLIIEAKQYGRNNDAYLDFVNFHIDGRKELSAEHWKHKWLIHLQAELGFPDGLMERPKRNTDGILPRSNRRKHIRLWAELGKLIDSTIRSGIYQETVLNNLQIRFANHNPTPYYYALIANSNKHKEPLSERSIASAKILQQMVGYDHVIAIEVSCEKRNEYNGIIDSTVIDI
jgi:hypothetical protein